MIDSDTKKLFDEVTEQLDILAGDLDKWAVEVKQLFERITGHLDALDEEKSQN